MKIEIIRFGQIEAFVLDYLKEKLSKIFDAQVKIGDVKPLPEYAYKKERRQYLSTAILDNISQPRDNNQKIIGVIDKDLYVPELNFVFGEADIQNGICIISFIRLRQTYYGLKEDKDLFLERTLKEAVHELGHLLNLRHCSNPTCVMYFSNSLLDTDKKDYRFCDKCKRLLP